jgi:hypothetical protein
MEVTPRERVLYTGPTLVSDDRLLDAPDRGHLAAELPRVAIPKPVQTAAATSES